MRRNGGHVTQHMPTNLVVALLKSATPAQAVGTLLSMTADRIAILLTEMEPAHIARLLLAAKADQKAGLFAAIPAERAPLVLQELSMPQFADFLSGIPTQTAAQLLLAGPPRWAADVLTELPAEIRARLQAMMTGDQPEELSTAVYERGVADSIVRIAARVSWFDQRTCDLLAEVFGRIVHVAVRYRARDSLTDTEIHEAATRANWRDIAGLVVVTNLALADSAAGHARAICRTGRALELLRWIDEQDDGALKRVLVRLAS